MPAYLPPAFSFPRYHTTVCRPMQYMPTLSGYTGKTIPHMYLRMPEDICFSVKISGNIDEYGFLCYDNANGGECMQNNAPRHIPSSAALQKRRAARKKLKRKKQCRALLLFVLLVGAIFLLVFSLRSCATRKNSETQNTPAQTTSPMPDTTTVQSDTTQTDSLPAEPKCI